MIGAETSSDGDVTVWTVKGGRHGEFEDRFLEHGLIGGGWTELPSLEAAKSKEDVERLHRAAYPEDSDKTRAAQVGQLRSLVQRMNESDLVVLPLKTTGTIAVGRVSGDYAYADNLGEDLRHVRPVEWIATDVPRDNFDQDLLYSFGAFLTVARVRRDKAAERVLAAIGHAPPSSTVTVTSDDEDDEAVADVEELPDVESLAREQVRQFVSRKFAGHELTRLVGAVLEAQGFSITVSPPGPDRGADILAGSGGLGLDEPRLVAQVKTGQADVDTFRALRGTMQEFSAEQGLLVAWGGFKGTVRQEARHNYFTVRLWDADNLLEEIWDVYEDLSDEIRTELPLKRVWALVAEATES